MWLQLTAYKINHFIFFAFLLVSVDSNKIETYGNIIFENTSF